MNSESTKVENTLEITGRSDTSIAKLKNLIYEKKRRVFKNEFEACDLILWKVDISAEGVGKLRTLEQPLDTNAKNTIIEKLGKKLVSLYDIAHKTVKTGANTCANISKPGDKMPFMERNIDKAIVRITRNIKCHLSKSKSKTDYDILVSGGAPGIGLKSNNQHLFVFLHIDEFQLIDEWESNAVMKRKMEEKLLFKEMINGLVLYMFSPSHIFVQPFLSGTAPQFVNFMKESSKVSFGFVNCPQLSFKAMLKIANHHAQKFDAEKFDCGEYKWMLCQPFIQLLEDTGGLPHALQYVFYECLETGCNRKKFFKTIDKQNFDNIFHNVKTHLQERY
ncbi:hypothetical protein GLOIN_2v1794374 [Rhizophagus irregularis DAOM 181602=DAOM 197198]|nr:hypothetical protein GLOIN_2v1794374 [Rhizophagus irregularis DAOM 181602=DAOM 197198]